jgi:hypothetical protein
MKKAVKVFYFIADAYVEHPKLPAAKLFEHYARTSRCGGPEPAKSYILQHKAFLASRMEKGAEGIKWRQTPIYDFLCNSKPQSSNHQTSTAQMPRKGQAQAAHTLVADERKSSRHSRRVETNSDDERPPNNGNLYRNGHASYQLAQEEVKARVNALWTVLQNAAGHERDLTLSNLARAVYQHFTFADEIQASDYIIFFAPEIVTKIQRKHIGKQLWVQSLFYAELLNSELSRSTRAKIAQLNVRKRDEAVYMPQGHDDDEDTSSGDELSQTRQSRHAKGGLRPKGKGTAKKSKSYTGPADPSAMDMDTESQTSNGRKRKHTLELGNLPKRTRSFALASEVTTPQSENLDSAYETDDGEDEDEQSPIRTAMPTLGHQNQMTLALLSTPNHDPFPNTPGDEYTCPHAGCMHIVYAASSSLGQELIAEHLAEHDDKMAVVVNEKKLSNLPVGNLIKRIREMAAFEGNDWGLEFGGVLGGRQTVQRAL